MQVIREVGEYRFLTRDQIQALLFSPTTTSSCKRRLTLLFHHGYLDRVYAPVTTPYGAPRAVYCLGRSGGALLHAQQRPFRLDRGWRRQDNDRELIFLAHTLATNDVRIAAVASAGAHGWPVEWIDERALRRALSAEKVVDPRTGRAYALIPDGHAVIQASGSRYAFAVELDRGTVEEKRARRKLRLLGAWLQSGAYTRRFGLDSLRVLFVVEAGSSTAARLCQLRRWCESDGGGSLFWFAEHRRVVASDPLVDPIWEVAGERGRHHLLGRPAPTVRARSRRVPAVRGLLS